MVRILICEEEFLDRSRMRKLLSEFGDCDVVTNATECQEACIAAARSGHPYDLITLDLRVSDLDDSKVIEQLRAMKQKSQSRVLFTMPVSEVGKEHGASGKISDGEIVRPFVRDRVHDKLRDLGLAH